MVLSLQNMYENRQRELAYRELFGAHIDDAVMAEVRASWQTGTPLGNDRFREKIESVSGQKVGYSRRGRPAKAGKGL